LDSRVLKHIIIVCAILGLFPVRGLDAPSPGRKPAAPLRPSGGASGVADNKPSADHVFILSC
jgi:hypothetical protein